MTKAITILYRVVVNHFYSVNSGFFLFVFFVLFGLPYSVVSFHLSLIAGIIQSRVFLGAVVIVWSLYNLKCIDYVLKQLALPQQSFPFCLNHFSSRKLYVHMLFVQVMVYLPVLLYASIITVIASKKHEYLSALEVILVNTVIVTTTPFIYINAIRKTALFAKRLALPPLNINLPKPFFLVPFYFLWYERKQMLFVTKVFSLLLLYGFINLYEPVRHDIRPLLLCLLLTAATHTAIVFQVQAFGEEFLSFSKNLPLETSYRFLHMVALFACLLLPELLLLFKGVGIHFTLSDYPQLALLVISLLCFFNAVLLLEQTSMEQLLRIVFAIIAACFFIILYSPGILLPVVILLLSFLLFTGYYHRHEKKYETK